MIRIESTPNLTGVKIVGSFDDLYELVEAFYDISIDDFSDKHQRYVDISTRLLGLCYDIRHSYQGDREIELVDNGMDKETMKFHEKITPEKNVHYSCCYLYPEMFFCMSVINELILLRVKDITKTKYIYSEMLHSKIVWNKTICFLRSFQSAFAECVKNTLPERSYTMWLKEIADKDISMLGILPQYIDLVNINYLNMDKEKRLKNFMKFTKQITRFYSNDEHNEIKQDIYAYAEETNCSINDVRLADINYPEEIVW